MTAVSTLVQDAMFAARVLGQDETATSADVQLVLRRLQRMLDSWSNEKQMIFRQDEESFPLTAGVGTYSTSLFTEDRPIAIDSMRVRFSQVDYPVERIDAVKWAEIGVKDISAIPAVFYYDAQMPEANITFYPKPSSSGTCFAFCQRVLTGALTLTTDLILPPGYEAAIVAGLAADIWPSFKQGDVPKALIADRTQTRSVIKRTNFIPMEMDNPLNSRGAGDYSNALILPAW